MNLPDALNESLRKLGLLPLATGVLAVVFATIALFWPGGTVTSIVVILSIYLLITGIGTIVTGMRLRALPGSGMMIAVGTLSTILALIMMWHPGMSTRILVGFMGACLVMFGLFVVAISLAVRSVTGRWTWSLPAGAVAGILGLIFLARPGFGADALGTLLGVGVLAFGLTLIAAGVQLRRFAGTVTKAARDSSFTGDGVIPGSVVPDAPTHHSDDPNGPVPPITSA